MRDALPKRAFIWITGVVDRRVGWHRLPEPLASRPFAVAVRVDAELPQQSGGPQTGRRTLRSDANR
jgi:hypothetical protein